MSEEKMSTEEAITDSVLEADNKIVGSTQKTDSNLIKGIAVALSTELKSGVIDAFMLNEQRQFHENLTFLEKYVPFVGKQKEEQFVSKLRFRSTILNYSLSLGVEAFNQLFDEHAFTVLKTRYVELPAMFKSIVFNLLLINKGSWSGEKNGLTENARRKIQGTMYRHSLGNSGKKIQQWVNDFYKQSTPDIKELPETFRKDINKTALYVKSLLRMCDVDDLTNFNSSTYKEARDVIVNYFGFSSDEFNTMLATSFNENALQSIILDIPQYSINDFLQGYLQNITDSDLRIQALAELDPFRVKRQAYKGNVLETGSLLAQGLLKTTDKGTFDFFVTTAAPIIRRMFYDSKNTGLAELTNRAFYEHMSSVRKQLSDE